MPTMELTEQEVHVIAALRACATAYFDAAMNGDNLPQVERSAPQHSQPRQNAPQRAANAGNGHQDGGSDSPQCPKCSGPMFDERKSKYWNGGLSQSGKQKPIFKCRDRDNCDGVIWPPKDNHRTPEQQANFDALDTGPHTPNFADNRQRAVASLADETF